MYELRTTQDWRLGFRICSSKDLCPLLHRHLRGTYQGSERLPSIKKLAIKKEQALAAVGSSEQSSEQVSSTSSDQNLSTYLEPEDCKLMIVVTNKTLTSWNCVKNYIRPIRKIVLDSGFCINAWLCPVGPSWVGRGKTRHLNLDICLVLELSASYFGLNPLGMIGIQSKL